MGFQAISGTVSTAPLPERVGRTTGHSAPGRQCQGPGCGQNTGSRGRAEPTHGLFSSRVPASPTFPSTCSREALAPKRGRDGFPTRSMQRGPLDGRRTITSRLQTGLEEGGEGISQLGKHPQETVFRGKVTGVEAKCQRQRERQALG